MRIALSELYARQAVPSPRLDFYATGYGCGVKLNAYRQNQMGLPLESLI
jgi:hypothetical protein